MSNQIALLKAVVLSAIQSVSDLQEEDFVPFYVGRRLLNLHDCFDDLLDCETQEEIDESMPFLKREMKMIDGLLNQPGCPLWPEQLLLANECLAPVRTLLLEVQ